MICFNSLKLTGSERVSWKEYHQTGKLAFLYIDLAELKALRPGQTNNSFVNSVSPRSVMMPLIFFQIPPIPFSFKFPSEYPSENPSVDSCLKMHFCLIINTFEVVAGNSQKYIVIKQLITKVIKAYCRTCFTDPNC